jgi:ubiquinone/menaquinone biosynthesis C-methylase UbiE
MAEADDLERLRKAYTDRDLRLAGSDIYSYFDRSNLFMLQGRQRAVLKALQRHQYTPLANKRILELGCGKGGVLLEFLSYGASPERLHGTDLIYERVRGACQVLPHLPLTCADGQNLPYESNTFDLIFQFTVFSSILDQEVKANLAQEMMRVLREPEGMIMWYDFWVNPANPHTRGIRPMEIRRLFPRCQCDCHRITLAPPVTRHLVPLSWGLASIIESLKVLNSHYLALIYPR